MNYMVGLMIVALVVQSNAADLPSGITACHTKSPEFLNCLSKSITAAFILLADGLKSFNILPLDPLAIDRVSIGESGGVVAIKQDYTNLKIHGLTKGLRLNEKSASPDLLTFRSDAYLDKLDFVGDYVMSGKILLLPINGHGRANISMQQLTIENRVKYENFEKNGETYFRMLKHDMKFFPKKVEFDFENLFNGNPTLSTQINKILNENANLVFNESKAPFEETFSLLAVNTANKIFSRVPVNRIFPD